MFAVIKTGGKQYKVAKNDVLTVERLAGEAGSTVNLDQVLMVGEGAEAPKVGAPTLAGASVAAEVVEHTRGRKIRVFKKKRRKHYRRTAGHRQDLTVLRVTDIRVDGAEPAASAGTEAGEAEAKAPKSPSRSAQKKASQDAATQRSKAKATTTRQRAAGTSSPSAGKAAKSSGTKTSGTKTAGTKASGGKTTAGKTTGSKTSGSKTSGGKGASGGGKAKKSE